MHTLTDLQILFYHQKDSSPGNLAYAEPYILYFLGGDDATFPLRLLRLIIAFVKVKARDVPWPPTASLVMEMDLELRDSSI